MVPGKKEGIYQGITEMYHGGFQTIGRDFL